MNPFSPKDVQPILDRSRQLDNAQIFDAGTQHPFRIQSMTLALTTAQLSTDPLKVGFPFKAVWVQGATDSTTSVNLKIGSRDSFQSVIPLKLNDAMFLDKLTSEAYLDWSAQSGKTLTVFFFVDARFSPGSLINAITGQVVVGFGSSVGLGQTTLSAATAAIVAPALSTRKQCTLQNQSGASIFVGDSTVAASGATQGIEVLNKGTFTWNNTGALYAISAAGGVVNRLEEA